MIYKRKDIEAWEPVSLAEARLQCKLIVDPESGIHEDDPLLQEIITAARERVEHDASLCLVKSTFEGYIDSFPPADIILQQSPVTAVTKVEYMSNGVYVEWPQDQWEANIISMPGRVHPRYGYSYPTHDTAYNAVKVTFTAGYTNAGSVPKLAKMAMLLLIGHWYEVRQTVIIGTIATEVPETYNSVIELINQRRFG